MKRLEEAPPLVKRLLAFLFPARPYGCGCGKRYRDEDGLSRCVWKHALEA